MQWIEVTLRVDGEAAEAVVDLLQRYGHQGVSVEQEGVMPGLWEDHQVEPPKVLAVRAYFAADARAEDTKAQLEVALGHMSLMYPMPTPEYKLVADEDWAEAWKAHYHALRVGKRLLIRPRWIQMEEMPDDIVIALDPGMAFGTGTHPSTQLCLEAIESLTQPGTQVLDMGTGSGILAIAAVKLGAAHVLAIDIDPVAVQVAQENAAENGVADKITAQTGSLESVTGSARRFDLVVVNIIARVIIQMCQKHLGDTVRPGGRAIFSGIIHEQVEEVEAALRATGLEPYTRRQQGDWVVIEALRPT
jgi:ribosomal protein L11 methyltransferase